MSLKLLQPGCQPLGQFDAVDSELTSFKGGEICSFTYTTTEATQGVTQAGIDEAAYDVFDGYVNTSGTLKRPAVSKNWNSTVLTPSTSRPLFLADDGITGYGTLFGTVVGGTVGQSSFGPNSTISSSLVLGPHTALGSGKITLWDKPGLYAVSLDACDTTVTTGLQPTNTTTLTVGTALGFTSLGLLTPFAAAANVSTASVGRFVEFATNGSLVNTPNYLVAALNSPSGNVSSVGTRQFAFAVFFFQAPV